MPDDVEPLQGFIVGHVQAHHEPGVVGPTFFNVGGLDENFEGSALGEDAEFSHRFRAKLGRLIFFQAQLLSIRVLQPGRL